MSEIYTKAQMDAMAAIIGDRIKVATDKPFDQMIQGNSRMLSNPDGRWISAGDDNYGINIGNATESAGTGVNPLIEWETRAHFIKEGMTIPKYQLSGRCNDITNSPEWELVLHFKYPTANRWDDLGLDNDSEITSTEIYRGLWRTPVTPDPMGQMPFTHPINDIHRRTYDIDFTAPADGYFNLFMRPLRLEASVGNDYFYADEVIFLKYNH